MSVKIGFWKKTKEQKGVDVSYRGFGLKWDDGHTMHYSFEYHSFVGSLWRTFRHYRNELKRLERLHR